MFSWPPMFQFIGLPVCCSLVATLLLGVDLYVSTLGVEANLDGFWKPRYNLPLMILSGFNGVLTIAPYLVGCSILWKNASITCLCTVIQFLGCGVLLPRYTHVPTMMLGFSSSIRIFLMPFKKLWVLPLLNFLDIFNLAGRS
ncbi:hypothetical protein LOK49_Contig77G00007 [Camellia lanceoleosa]|nr:hypothetical protein LOK49_Contig77G00007 [Camellia lanceoleosa]